MSSTNKTTYYNLSQFANNDKPSWLNDYNNDMTIIDTNLKLNSNNVGDLTNLTTTSKTNVVSAINEVDSNTDTNTSSIGDLTSLTTTAKTDLVSAINEVASSSGGSCKVHYLNAGDYNSRTNALNFDTLENGIYIFYKSSIYTYDNFDVYFKKSADSQAGSTSFVSLKNGAMLVKCKNWSDSTGQYDILGYISYIYFTSYSATTNINQVLARFVKYSNGNLVIQKNDMTLITNDNKTSIATGYNASKTQTLKNVNGTLTWVDDV